MKRSDLTASVLALVCAVLVAVSFGVSRHPGDTDGPAAKVERLLSGRLATLDAFARKALGSYPSGWMDLPNLPEDMVIYRYQNDTLQSWCHQFTVANDNLSPSQVPCLSDPRIRLRSPLQYATDSLSFLNAGPKRYLVKCLTEGDTRVLAGLEISSDLNRTREVRVNQRLRLPQRYSISELSETGGSAVYAEGHPVFKVTGESLSRPSGSDAGLLWISVAFFLAAVLIFVSGRKTLPAALWGMAGIVVSMALVYIRGLGSSEVRIFSPSLYAGDGFFYSLGAVLVTDIAVILSVVCLFIVRKDIAMRNRTRPGRIISIAAGVAGSAALLLLVHMTLGSIIRNSNISLEIYKLDEFSIYTVIVYLATLGVLICIPMLLQLIQPAFSRIFGRHLRISSGKGRSLASAFIAVYVVLCTAISGFRKEAGRVEVWSSRLAMERDISLEIHLREIEQPLLADEIVATLSGMPETDHIIQNRIVDLYFQKFLPDYDISVRVAREKSATREQFDFFNTRMHGAEAVAEGSSFTFKSGGGGPQYTGVFLYYDDAAGLSRVLVCLDAKISGTVGYAGILGVNPRGSVYMPASYSYGIYRGRELQAFNGNYAYQTVMDSRLRSQVLEEGLSSAQSGGYTHFLNVVNDEDVVIISRPRLSAFNYVIAGVFVALFVFLVLSLATMSLRRVKLQGRRYYKTRISVLLMSSLVVTLAAMTVISVLFVYRRNEDNMRNMMSDRLNYILGLVQSKVKGAASTEDLANQEMMMALEDIHDNVGSDLTLYTPDGRVFLSSSPEIFETMLLGNRMNEDAYNAIVYMHRRYFLNKERLDRERYYSMYAPVLSADGRIIAILCTPYYEQSYNFEKDVVMHSMAIITVFLLLLLLVRLAGKMFIERLLKPISVMGRRMTSANLDTLEHIEYDGDDEVSTLVQSYNRMVDELSESSQKLAQAERDKAWSGMARQVAHEIKNPLTPMKLQLQRIIRLKQRNDPSWQTKFDEVAEVLLSHIDILSDTANQFSTFAKLYTEEHTEIDLYNVLQEEIAMFDNKENIRFDYMGLQGVTVMGPKPQLTRVFVNLINNSVQALEGREDGRIMVSLRKSSTDGCFDIVFEDNGPGVDRENVERLFEPNFTTKNGGSGLGLAISRSILERCDASISYSKSFTLGGACFTIRYPGR